ncbi:MAG TPA: ABC transporter ATP-binding protein [Methanoculleus sp.]|nr:ABC transporter ATP-binding protein [Methanoculleus sp.]
MIRVDHIDVSYDGATKILAELSFTVERGAFIGIIGPNGSGKTTLLKTISRILSPTGGVVRIDGRDLASIPNRDLARTLGVVPQETAINFDFTVMDVVLMGRHPHIDRLASESKEDIAIARRAMAMTGTEQFRDRSVNEISGGERQRVIIARALAQEPKVLLLDEPTSHLDISHQIEILNIFKKLEGEVTTIGVFHDLNLAAHYCDTLILLDRGEIRAMGSPADVLTRDHLGRIFHINATVKKSPRTGKPYVIPIIGEGAPLRGALRIHLICGGGTGSDLMHELHQQGYALSAGVLCINDSDYEIAAELGIPCITEPPFGEIRPDSLHELEVMLGCADAVIVTDMPVGRGNLANIRILERYCATPIILFGRSDATGAARDFTGGEAERLFALLKARGATAVADYQDLWNTLQDLERRGDPAEQG